MFRQDSHKRDASPPICYQPANERLQSTFMLQGEVFQQQKELKGQDVRLFQGQTSGRLFVVKKTAPSITAYYQACKEAECALFKVAYPAKYANLLTLPNHSLRSILSYMPGTLFNDVISSAMPIIDLLYVFLMAAIELKRLHQLGIIHGDIKANNLVVRRSNGQPSVEWIDFEYATKVGEPAIKFSEDPSKYPYLAPERFNTHLANLLVTHPAQDVFSFAKMAQNPTLRTREGSGFDSLLLRAFPSLDIWVSRAVVENPEERPSLDEFIEAAHMALWRLYERKQKETQPPTTSRLMP